MLRTMLEVVHGATCELLPNANLQFAYECIRPQPYYAVVISRNGSTACLANKYFVLEEHDCRGSRPAAESRVNEVSFPKICSLECQTCACKCSLFAEMALDLIWQNVSGIPLSDAVVLLLRYRTLLSTLSTILNRAHAVLNGGKATHNYANPTPNPNPNYCHIGNPQCQWDYPSHERFILYGYRRKSSWMLHAVRVMNYFAQSLVHSFLCNRALSSGDASQETTRRESVAVGCQPPLSGRPYSRIEAEKTKPKRAPRS